MVREGLKLLPSIQALERLLSHNLNITEGIIESRVNEAIDRQLQDYYIQEVALDESRVDWNRVKLDAAYRRPPFEQTDKNGRTTH